MVRRGSKQGGVHKGGGIAFDEEHSINIHLRRSARTSWICAGSPLPPGGVSGAVPGALRPPGRGVQS
eukprot:3422573-Pyramimonas_sp.AAC.1